MAVAVTAGGAVRVPAQTFPARDCLGPPYSDPVTPGQQVIADAVGRLRDAAAAYPSLVAALEARGPEICLDARSVGARGHFDLGANVIAINRGLEPAEVLAILIHEVRHLDQIGRGICPSDGLAMEEVARATFAMEADANAVLAHVAWELRAAGEGAVWDAFLGFEHYADIGPAYAAAREAGGSVAQALGSAFEQWYASDWRRERYYVASCSDYLDRADATHRVPEYGMIDDDFFARLCRLPDGSGYDCTPPVSSLRP
ncbi:DUF6782 family putative metallopeptidase [Palleronia sp. KMU-117]|uniref:DUF6782 family putative metallopeptidase n=1 Tax=Palleronia sp. KMU-117 TaxID=3434108 RepID=UPI003D717A36